MAAAVPPSQGRLTLGSAPSVMTVSWTTPNTTIEYASVLLMDDTLYV